MSSNNIRAIRERFSGQSGISFLVALMFMIVSATIVAIVISSAAVNAERAKQHQVEEQGYFAVQSALQLVNTSAKNEDGGIVNTNIDKRLTMAGSLDNLQPSREPSSRDLGLGAWASEQAIKVGQGQSPSTKTVIIPKFTYNGVEVPAVELTYRMEGEGSFRIQVEARVKAETLPGSSEAAVDYANTVYLYYRTNVATMQDGSKQVGWEEGAS